VQQSTLKTSSEVIVWRLLCAHTNHYLKNAICHHLLPLQNFVLPFCSTEVRQNKKSPFDLILGQKIR